MICSGIFLGYGIFNPLLEVLPVTKSFHVTLVILIIASWHLGSITGFIASTFYCETFTKKAIYLLSNFLLLFSSGALIAYPVDFYVVVFTRYFAGIAHGLCYVTIISHLSENCTKWIRAMHASANFLFLNIGLVISLPAIIAYANGKLDVHPLRVNGIVCCVISIIAIYFTIKFSKESVIDLINAGHDIKALRTMQYLRCENFETTCIRDDFDDMKMMILEDKTIDSSSIITDSNLKPLMLTLLLKVAFVLSFNNSLNVIRLNVHFANDFILVCTLLPRVLIGFIVIYTIEHGRRIHFITSSTLTAIVIIILGFLKLFQLQYNLIDLILFIIYEIAVSLGVGSVSCVYDSEAFRTIKKTKSIAFTSIIEQILQIIFILLTIFIFNDASRVFELKFSEEIFLFSSAALLIVITIYMFYHIPETKAVSIRRTRNMFLST